MSAPAAFGPRASVRWRLTLTYGAVFAGAATVLLLVSYALVDASVHSLPLNPAAYLQLARGVPVTPPPALLASVRDALAARSLSRLEVQYMLVFVAMLVVSGLLGWWMAGRVLRPLREITDTARRVSRDRLEERIALTGPDDELRELADTFDGMLDRLQSAFAGQQRFIANVSHELRTPLTVIRTEVDVALSDPEPSSAELSGTRDVVRRAVDRSERLIDSLLMLARSDAGPPGDEPVALDRRARECLALQRARLTSGGLSIDRKGLAPAVARGEPQLLERVVDNLIENAVRHNVRGGWVRLSSWVEGDRAHLRVSNAGAMIDPRELEHLTEPFRRLSNARTGEGAGLGLSIVLSVVELHGGSLLLTAPPAGGLVAEVSLPAAAGTHAGVGERWTLEPRRPGHPGASLH